MRSSMFAAATLLVACATPKQAATPHVPVEDQPPVEGVDVPCTRPAIPEPAGEWVDPMSIDAPAQKQQLPTAKPDRRVDCTGTSI